MFLDEARIIVRSGGGGHGCVSFRREKFVPRGGPDGGNGGAGGSVVLRARRQLNTLLDVSRRRHFHATNGRPGSGNNRTGKSGADVVIDVPIGTVVREVVEGREEREGLLLGDLVRHGQKLIVARGGKGGRGNKSYASSTHQVPRIAQEGRPGEERRLYLELKLLADVGLIGLPNAGKSTLLAGVSAATPKVADYPFTTLRPNLGIAELDGYRRLVVADIPGLIEGAHKGHGLGIEFLRHIERTRALVHLVSVESRSVETMVDGYRTICMELGSYSAKLTEKPVVVAASKIDLLPPAEQAEFCAEFGRQIGAEVLAFSTVTRQGVAELLQAAAGLVEAEAEACNDADDGP